MSKMDSIFINSKCNCEKTTAQLHFNEWLESLDSNRIFIIKSEKYEGVNVKRGWKELFVALNIQKGKDSISFLWDYFFNQPEFIN